MKKLISFAVLAVAIVCIALELYFQNRSHPLAVSIQVGPPASQATTSDGALSKFSTVPDFTLTDRSGATVTRSDLKGKVWLADFVYTTCPDTCPMLSSKLSDLQAKALELGDVRFVSFSVDPEHDTPAVLQGYAAHLKATDRWFFLTGDKAQVKRIASEGFLLGFEKDPGEAKGGSGTGSIIHSTKIALVDRNGVVRRFYDGTGAGADESDKILADLKTLLKEAKP